MKKTISGGLRKMRVALVDGLANYEIVANESHLEINQLIGKELTLSYSGAINCIHCGRKTSKSFNQGHCFPCFKSLARCDQCIVSPEKCHYHKGTCREPSWADEFCMQDHIVYLSNTSGIKVGITRVDQVPTRWIDQGAVSAIPIYRVSSRRISGLVEQSCKDHLADKTNWRAMLKGNPAEVDLEHERDRIHGLLAEEVDFIQQEEGITAVQEVNSIGATEIAYPVAEYLEKISSLNLDKQAEWSGKFLGIKGQYLMLSVGVINLRKYAGYDVSFEFN